MEAASAASSTARQNQPEQIYANNLPYDVFINHRGSDVKHTLASAIYHTLNLLGARVFLDVEVLEAADVIPEQLQPAIATASLYIAILSPNYARSTWCLAELSFMLKTATKIIPIFYKVEPSQIRWISQGKGIYARAFSEHERKGRYTPEKLDEWRKALNIISIHFGYIVNDDEDEGRLLKNIVNHVLRVMKKVPLDVAKHPIGLDAVVEDFERTVLKYAESHQNLKIVGIVGMGGSGKTTLAKALFNRRRASVERCSFIVDVRDAASRCGLHSKQRKLLDDLGVHHMPFDDVEIGKTVLAKYLPSLRVLIVLDDVDHIYQLDALLPNIDRLESDSLVIVTTRDLGVLLSWGISCNYHMPLMDRSHAEQLFSWHAFSQPNPPSEFKNLVEKFVMACNGLPLSLTALGAQLHGKNSKDYWESQLNKILRILPADIKRRMQVSYDALDKEEQQIFLDVACFFVGEEKSLAIAVWDGSGWNGLHGLETLVNKCLVELDEDSCIRMHDHLRVMGIEIASMHSPYRLWFPGQIINIQKHSQEKMLVRGIIASNSKYPSVPLENWVEQFMAKSGKGLKILHVQSDQYTEEFASLSEGLVWLRLYYSRQKRNLPSWLSFRNLSVLELNGASDLEELWEDNLDPPLQLRELRIADRLKFQRFPTSIGCIKHLKKIVVNKGFCGRSLPEEFCSLQSLEHLELPGSVMLSYLPDRFGSLVNLRHINLGFCEQLRLPVSFKQLIHLEYLNLEGCREINLPDLLENVRSLEYLNIHNCKQLEYLPGQITNLASLRELDISDANLRDVPTNIGELQKLEILRIGSAVFTSLPTYIGNLSSSTTLDMYAGCGLPKSLGQLKHLKFFSLIVEDWKSSLLSLPEEFCLLQSLEHLVLQGCHKLLSLPNHFGDLINLRRINLSSCHELKMLPVSFKQLIHLEYLVLTSCKMLSSLPAGFGDLINLRHIDLSYCSSLRMLPVSFKHQILLEYLDLTDCMRLSISSDMLENVTSLKNFIFFKYTGLKESIQMTRTELNTCTSIEKFVKFIGHLQQLETIVVDGYVNTSLKALPEEFCLLKVLRHLTLRWCMALTLLPTDFGNLKSLQHLDLAFCSQLKELPHSFKQMKQLLYLNFQGCSNLRIPPHFLGKITTLQSLIFKDCGKLRVLPNQVPYQLSLRSLNLVGTSLEELPSEVGMLINLEVLEIGSPYLTELPVSMGNLMNLRTLNVDGCTSLTCLPDSLGLLENLSSINAPQAVKETVKQILDTKKVPI